MSSILSVYLSDHHSWDSTTDYMRRLQPAWVRIHQPTARALWRVQQAAPQARIMLRSWDIDDHNGDRKREAYADPAGAAFEHLALWREKLAELINELEGNNWGYDTGNWHLGLINEPDPAYLPQVVEYTKTAMQHAQGWPLGVMVPSVGNFGIPGQDPNDWSLVKPLEQAIRDGGHILMVHEYWQPEGPTCVWTDEQGRTREDAGNLAWRHQHIPLDVPILIGESGANGYIFNRHSSEDNAGWQRFMTPARYAEQVREYIQGCDDRVQGVCLYLTDYHSDQWRTFDTTPAHEALLALRDVRPTWRYKRAEEEHTVHIPAIVVQPDPPEEQVMSVLDPVVMMAILDVESGAAFGEGGRLVIRFEAHIFKNELRNDALFDRHFRVADERAWVEQQYWRAVPGEEWVPIHTGEQASEWAAFRFAESMNRRAALRSISMGRGQIMGFNHERVGYASVEQMFAAFADRQSGEAAQIVAFINYILGDPDLFAAVRGKDWRTIAAKYNGAGGVDVYSRLLEAAWQRRAG